MVDRDGVKIPEELEGCEVHIVFTVKSGNLLVGRGSADVSHYNSMEDAVDMVKFLTKHCDWVEVEKRIIFVVKNEG